MTDGNKDTALGIARTRFVEGLAKKSDELDKAIAEVRTAPGAGRARDELRRRLHTLYASSQVFHLNELAELLKGAIARIDRASDDARALNASELYELNALPARVAEFGPPRQASIPAGVQRVQRLVQTLTGMPPSMATSSSLMPKSALAAPGVPSLGDIGAPAAPREPDVAPLAPPAPAQVPVASVGAPSRQSIAAIQPVKKAFRTNRPSGAFDTRGRPQSDLAPGSVAPARAKVEAIVTSILVVDAEDVEGEIRRFLPTDHFEVLGARDVETGLRLARSTAPDIVLIDAQLALDADKEFIRRLRNDPLTDFVPVVLLLPPGMLVDSHAMRDLGADDAIAKPLQVATITRVLTRAMTVGVTNDEAFLEIGDATVAEVADRIAAEVRRGLLESMQTGHDIKVPVGEGASVLAAVWSTIARARAELAARSGGRVRFRDLPRRGGAALLSLSDEDGDELVESLDDVSIEKRRILVVDDDPSIVWFFAGVLREAGADVTEASNGQDALDKMRARRVDLVVSDILMPEVDGFGLCREMRRDPALADTPVILISWKEDLLQRMRDLQSGANDYLRKEAGGDHILRRVRKLLRPVVRLEAELRSGAEVRGSIERVSVLRLLRTVARERADARVTIRDAWNFFEIDVRGGRLVDITRTATDGAFARGPGCVPQLLGVTSGRYSVVVSTAAARATLDRPLEDVLDEGVATLAAVMDAVSSTGLSRAHRVAFDEEALAAVMQASPPDASAIVERLKHGAGPRELLTDGTVAPQMLEGLLLDLARRGAIRAVFGPAGEDCVGEARARRGVFPAMRFASLLPAPATSAREPAAAPSPSVVVTPIAAAAPVVVEPSPKLDTAPPAAPEQISLRPLATDSQVKRELSELFPDVRARPAMQSLLPASAEPFGRKKNDESTEYVPTVPPPTRTSGVAVTTAPPSEGGVPMVPIRKSHRPEATERMDRDEPSAAPEPTIPPKAEQGLPTWVWALVVLALGAAGFFGYRAYQHSQQSAHTEATAPSASVPGHANHDEPAPSPVPLQPDPALAQAPAPAEEAVLPPLGDDARFGRVEPSIIDPHAHVNENQGLFVVEAPRHEERATVLVDDHEIGTPPLQIALDEGGHTVEIRHDDTATFAYVEIQRATSRIVPVR